jgi:hypothetical protein
MYQSLFQRRGILRRDEARAQVQDSLNHPWQTPPYPRSDALALAHPRVRIRGHTHLGSRPRCCVRLEQLHLMPNQAECSDRRLAVRLFFAAHSSW